MNFGHVHDVLSTEMPKDFLFGKSVLAPPGCIRCPRGQAVGGLARAATSSRGNSWEASTGRRNLSSSSKARWPWGSKFWGLTIPRHDCIMDW